jgi:hypothetical protein
LGVKQVVLEHGLKLMFVDWLDVIAYDLAMKLAARP